MCAWEHACLYSQGLWAVTGKPPSSARGGSTPCTLAARGVGARDFHLPEQHSTTEWITPKCKSSPGVHSCTSWLWLHALAACIDALLAGCRQLPAFNRKDPASCFHRAFHASRKLLATSNQVQTTAKEVQDLFTILGNFHTYLLLPSRPTPPLFQVHECNYDSVKLKKPSILMSRLSILLKRRSRRSSFLSLNLTKKLLFSGLETGL